MNHNGEKLFKAFNSRDVRAIRELVANGYRFVIVTADGDSINRNFANKTGAEILVLRDKNRITFAYEIAIGDDVWDIPMLKKAAIAYCPSNADSEVAKVAISLGFLGGSGLIAELCKKLFE
jgi:3-deoxy-D-manno-octulosonate 8-phosphate phosphatase KdsC-like HAD superfamily phosphatase